MLQVPRDSYVSVAMADAYHAIRPSQTVWAALETSQKEMRLVAASDYIDACYQLRDDLNYQMREANTEVVEAVYKAVCELALKDGLFENEAQQQTSLKVGDISVAYGRVSKHSRFEYIDAILAPYISGRINGVPVIRS